MNRRQATCLLTAMLPALAACGNTGGQTATVRFRVIAMFEVDGDPVEGSSVMEITYTRVTRSLIGAGGATTTKGEAIIVDLKGRGTVFVLPVEHYREQGVLMRVYEEGILSSLEIDQGIGALSDDSFQRLRRAKGRIPLWIGTRHAPSRWPAVVAFSNERVARSIYEIDLQDIQRHFSGVRFRGIDLEFTNAPITEALRKRLSWLNTSHGDPGWEREPPGSQRPMKEWPLSYKITRNHFFGNGSW